MDTGDADHSAWFHSRVQVLVRSLRAHQGGPPSAQWGDRFREQPSPSSPPPPRRSLLLGRSLASRWQQYSPAPLRRLRKLFSVSSEREQSPQDDWNDQGELKKDHSERIGDSSSLSEECPLLLCESQIASTSKTTTKEEIRESQQDINGSLKEVHQSIFPQEPYANDEPLNHSHEIQEHKVEFSSDSRNIPGDPFLDLAYNNKSSNHSINVSSVLEVSHIPQKHGSGGDEDGHDKTIVSGSGSYHDITSNLQQQHHDFTKRTCVLTTGTEDESHDLQQGAMTQWRLSNEDACTVKGQATVVQEVATNSSVCQEFSEVTVSSQPDSEKSKSNEEIDKEVEVLSLETESLSATVEPVKDISSIGLAYKILVSDQTMAQHLEEECLHKLEDSARVVEGEVTPTFTDESSEILAKSDMERRVISSAPETDKTAFSPPSIVLDLPQTIEQVPSFSEVTSSDSLGPQRPPKLQLQISATACSQPAARKSPVTVQEWVDSLPLPLQHRSEEEGGEEPSLEESDDHLDLGLGAEAGLLYDALPAVNVVSPAEPSPSSVSTGKIDSVSAARLAREPSVQSDVTSHTGSHCSSVESYLESRRPDPEEVLLGLGFGGSVGGTGIDTELSRIPRRFLQPSKVKGVGIDDFLRYQQDLIETFESGFSGYRGLTGPSHAVPSVIVAKIMEKLREHERENIPPGSVVSAPVIGSIAAAAPSPPTTSGKFSRAARRVLTRTTVLGALPYARQQQQKDQQQQSVLTPDNRRFLDNQGSKSPEVPRKRMIIGHRSYTFSCDGDLIELEPISPTTPTPNFPSKPKPFLHKDSVVSTATSLSLTSVDSDSDTDDHSSSFGVQNRHNNMHDRLLSSSPQSSPFFPSNVSQESPTEKQQGQRVSKRMSSTSLSSWESEAISPIRPCSDSRLSVRHQSIDELGIECPGEEKDVADLRVAKHYNRLHSNPESSLSASRPTRYESIDEDIEMKSDHSHSHLTTTREQSEDTPYKLTEANTDKQNHNHDRNEEQQTDLSSSIEKEAGNTVDEPASQHVDDMELAVDSASGVNDMSGEKCAKTQEEQVQLQKHIISLLQLRRSSLKRQQRVLDDDEPLEVSVSDSSNAGNESEYMSQHPKPTLVTELPPEINVQKQDDNIITERDYNSDVFINNIADHHSVDDMQVEHAAEETQELNTVKYENNLFTENNKLNNISHHMKGHAETGVRICGTAIGEPCNAENASDLLQVVHDTKGDSFEMEEICTYGEDEGHLAVLSRARSDSSGFLDGDSETHCSRMITNGLSIDGIITSLESSQHDTLSNKGSEAVQSTRESYSALVPVEHFQSDSEASVHISGVIPCVLSDKCKAEPFINETVDQIKLDDVLYPSNLSSASLNKEYAQKPVIESREISGENLTNNLYQELSKIRDWENQYDILCVPKNVSEVDESCAIVNESQRSIQRTTEHSSTTEHSAISEKNSYSFPICNTSVPYQQSAITSGNQNVTGKSSSDRTSLDYSAPAHQPAVLVDDKEMVRQRTMSLHGLESKYNVLINGVRRVRSAPHCLEHLTSGDNLMQGSSWNSFSNMFSFCSDESVIHVGVQRTSLSRTSEKRTSDACDSALYKPDIVVPSDTASDLDVNDSKETSLHDSTLTAQYLKPSAIPYARSARRSSSDAPSSSHSVKDLQELVGELADRGWDISMGTDSSYFACHNDQQLLRLQRDAVRAGLAAYGRQLVGQTNQQNGGREVAEANKELQTVAEVRDRIATELRHIADLLEEQPPQRAASITGQMAVLLREQTRLCRQLEALSEEPSPSIFVESAPCCSVLEAVREENRRLQTIVERNSQELTEIRQLLKELVAVKSSHRNES